jgi:hypothetical protein
MSTSLCPEKCTKYRDRRSVVSLKDPKGGPSNYIAKNPNQRNLELISVDECCFSGSACDFLMLVEDKAVYLIELKGSDVEKAIKQIESTLNTLSDKLKHKTIYVRIVPRKVPVPNIVRTDVERLRRRLEDRDRYRCQSRRLEEDLP